MSYGGIIPVVAAWVKCGLCLKRCAILWYSGIMTFWNYTLKNQCNFEGKKAACELQSTLVKGKMVGTG